PRRRSSSTRWPGGRTRSSSTWPPAGGAGCSGTAGSARPLGWCRPGSRRCWPSDPVAAYRPVMPMTMNQVIHAAVRRDLTRLDRALDAFPSGDAERANQLARAYRFVRHQLTDHHQSEDDLIWPVIAELGVDRALLDAMESEHHEMSEAL